MLNIESFQRLSAQQWIWLWCAFWRLWPINLRIKFKQGAWLRSKFIHVGPVSGEMTLDPSLMDRYQDAILMHESVRLAARLHFLTSNCLPKSIVLVDMLRRHSYPANVYIGVSKNDDVLLSHAWVELDGKLLCEPENVSLDFTVVESN